MGFKEAESLRKIIRSIGFNWKKAQSNRTILMDRSDIQKWILDYLRSILKFRQEGRPIIYMDETYIHSSHTTPKRWKDDSSAGLLHPVNKGNRFIIVHEGGEGGFVPGAQLIFKSD